MRDNCDTLNAYIVWFCYILKAREKNLLPLSNRDRVSESREKIL